MLLGRNTRTEMGRCILTCAALVAVFCLPSSEGTAYHIHTEEKTDENNDCIKYVKVDGDGIDDRFSTNCHAEVDRTALLNGVLVIGDYTKDRVSVFSDKPSSMVVIHGEDKQCEMRSYTPGHTETSKLSDDECKKYKERMTAEWKGSKSKRAHHNRKQHFFKWRKTQQSIGNADEDMYVITSFPDTKEGEKCVGTMAVGRSKLKYEEDMDNCSFRRIFFIPEGVIIGDYRTKDHVSRISDAVNSLISVYPEKICDKMLFTKQMGDWALDSNLTLTEEDCNKYMQKIADWLGDVYVDDDFEYGDSLLEEDSGYENVEEYDVQDENPAERDHLETSAGKGSEEN